MIELFLLSTVHHGIYLKNADHHKVGYGKAAVGSLVNCTNVFA